MERESAKVSFNWNVLHVRINGSQSNHFNITSIFFVRHFTLLDQLSFYVPIKLSEFVQKQKRLGGKVKEEIITLNELDKLPKEEDK